MNSRYSGKSEIKNQKSTTMKYGLNRFMGFIPKNEDGESVLKTALFFQKALGLEIFALSIIKGSFPLFHRLRISDLKKRINEEKEDMASFIRSIILKKIPKNIIVRIKRGSLIPTLIDESKHGGYEFMVVAKSEKSFACKKFKKKVNKLISNTHCPVLSICTNYEPSEIKKILVPIDITQSTKKRLLWTSKFAKKFGAKVHVVSALNIDMTKTRSLAYRNADKIKHLLTDQGIECELEVLKVHGKKRHQVIQDYIDEVKPDLLIMRTHQETTLFGSKIGEFVSELVHSCKMPVFTVN